MPSPVTTDEAARLAALRKYEVLDTPAEAAFDRIAALAARLFSVPISCLTLVDERRMWVKAVHGAQFQELPRDGVPCAWTILSDAVMVVPDAAQDSRFRANPLVTGPPGIRFYAGAALITPDGFPIGTLSIIDTEPRAGLAPGQAEALRCLADTAMDELELRRAAITTLRFSSDGEDLARTAADITGGLRLSGETLVKAIEALPVGVWITDHKGTILYGNSAAQAIWGGRRYVGRERYDEYQGWSIATGKRIAASEWALARTLTSGEVVLGEAVRIRTFDDKDKVVVNSTIPLRGPAGEITGAICVNEDITDRRRAEESLEGMRDQLRSIIDASPIAIIAVDLDGNRIQGWNRAAETMFGWRAEEILGLPLPVVPENLALEMKANRDSILRGQPFLDLETTRRRKDGTPIEVTVSGGPLHGPSGEVWGCMLMYSDRTQRAAAEKALRDSEERYRNLVEHSPDAIVVHADGRVLYANAAAAQLFGLASAAEAIGLEVERFVPPESRVNYEERTRRVLETGQLAPLIETRLAKLDGTIIDVETLSIPLRSEGRDAVQVVLRDITERKRVELRARVTERNLALLADNLPAFVTIKDRAGRYVMANRKLCDTVRCAPEEIPGKTDFDFLDEETARRHYEGDLTIMRAGKPTYVEEVVTFSGGARVDSGALLAPILSESGDVSGLLTVVFDLTEKRAMQAEIRRTEDWFRKAIQTAPIPIMIHSEDGRIVRLNDAWIELSGFDSAELAGVEDWIANACVGESGELREQFRGLYDLHSRSETSEMRIRTRTGKIRIWAVSHSPLGMTYEGKRAVITMAMDVTDQHNLEQQLAHSQKMEAIGQLAGGVAHDFNNLLTVIGGYSSLLLQSLPEYDPAKPHVQEIASAATRAASLTHQLLAFSRKQVLQPANVDLNSLVRDSENMLKRLIGEDIEVQFHLAEDELRAMVDAGQFTQVIMNLAVNARDAMPDGGVLTIETLSAQISEEYASTHPEAKAGSYVQVAVSDTGVGIDPVILPRIFEPFFTTKTAGSGTGLGLATVYGIIKQSNGHIGVYSEPGHGTTFRVYLPRLFEAPAPVEARSIAAGRRATETVLLVEDEPELRRLTRTILASAGYKVIEAANGGAALLACEQVKAEIALMLTDVVMPGMSGPDLATRLAPLRPNMKVLYMSGYTDRAVVANKALESGLDFIQKPFTPESLIDRVREILDRGRDASQSAPA